jgi:hypothetical protein
MTEMKTGRKSNRERGQSQGQSVRKETQAKDHLLWQIQKLTVKRKYNGIRFRPIEPAICSQILGVLYIYDKANDLALNLLVVSQV